MILPWERSVRARLLLILVGLNAAVLLIINLSVGWLLTKAQLEESANHLQIHSLTAARTLEEPLARELKERERSEHYRVRVDDEDEDVAKRNDDDGHHDGKSESSDKANGLAEWVRNFSSESGSQVAITDPAGRVLVATSDRSEMTSHELQSALKGSPLHRFDGKHIYASAPISRKGKIIGVIQLRTPKSHALRKSWSLISTIALASLATLALAFLVALWLSQRLVKPLKQLEASALSAAKGEWEQSLPIEGQDEIATLSRAFSQMLTSLQTLVARQRRFISDASHELRTPLTRMKLRTEALLDGALQDEAIAEKFLREVDGELDRMSELTTSLLDLARYDEQAAVSRPVTDPTSLILRTSAAHQATAEQKEIDFVIRVADALAPLAISPQALVSAVDNLVSNAIKYTAPGGKVTLQAERASNGVEITVTDTGIGIAAEHLPHVFERFYRAQASRTARGTGLGLALVKAAVESGGGSVGVTSTLGQGSAFRIDLPGC